MLTDHERAIPEDSRRGGIPPQFFRFAAVGACGTLVQYGTLWSGVAFASMSAAMASGIGYLLGSLVNYWLNYYFTFSSDKSHMDAMPKFYAVVGVGWGLNTSLMAWLADWLGWNKWIAQALATAICFGWHFAASKYLVFRRTT